MFPPILTVIVDKFCKTGNYANAYNLHTFFQREIMKNPLYTKGLILKYIIVGLIAAIGYFNLLWAHMSRASYESSYLLYVGNAVFGAVTSI